MKMLWLLAWRNLWRSKRRTIITASAIGLSVMMMSFSIALTDGMVARLVRTATRSQVGDAQLQSLAYAQTGEETQTLDALPARLKAAQAVPQVEAASARVVGLGLIAIGDRAQGAKLLGVDPKQEQRVTSWQDQQLQGRYIQAPGELMLGAKLAQRLDVQVDSKVVLTTANVHTGESSAELMRVVGVLSSGSAELDQSAAILELGQAQRMLGLEGQAHEIALRLNVPSADRDAIVAALKPLNAPQLSVRPWHDINKMIASVLGLMDKWLGIVVFLIFGIIAFGIVNTLSMSLAERTHEFGVMRALGTARGRLVALLLLEAFILGLVGALPGAALGLGLSYGLSMSGISLVSTSAYGVSFVEPLYPIPNILWTLRTALLFATLTMLTGVVGALRVAKMDPVLAMRG